MEDRFEAGIELFGTEVKAIRAGGVNLKDSWCSIDGRRAFVNGMHISPYDKGKRVQPRQLPREKVAYAQKGDNASLRHPKAAGVDPDSAFGLFQGLDCQGQRRTLQR